MRRNKFLLLRVIDLLLILLLILGYQLHALSNANQAAEAEIASLKSEVQTAQEEAQAAQEEAAQAKAAQEQAAQEQAQTEKDNSSDSASGSKNQSSTSYKDGTYTGSAQGFRGEIEVEVTITSGKIASINIISAPGDDPPYLNRASQVIDDIINSQSTDVDTVTGATFSSTGILNATNAALQEAMK